MSPKPELHLRYMTMNDLPEVGQIDRLSFEIPWSQQSFRYEILESDHSYMVVLEYHQSRSPSRWQRWLHMTPVPKHHIVGYGGMWNVVGEAHISSIAVHPRARGRGWGEILLAGMIKRGIIIGADEVALEVRVSNTRAQNLYKKYGFQIIGVKPRYYRNNSEDAYDMRLNILDEQILKQFEAQYRAIFERHRLFDFFSEREP